MEQSALAAAARRARRARTTKNLMLNDVDRKSVFVCVGTSAERKTGCAEGFAIGPYVDGPGRLQGN